MRVRRKILTVHQLKRRRELFKRKRISKGKIETRDATENPKPSTLTNEECKNVKILKNIIHKEVVKKIHQKYTCHL
jgi:hypothetical protein